MTAALVRSHEHLLANRRLILGHSVASSIVGLVPLPYVSDILPALVQRDLVRRIAESRGVDLDEAAVRMIAEGDVAPPSWRTLISAAPLLRFARRGLRAAFMAWNVWRHAEGATRTFALATLFDHYCSRLHVGGELDGRAARALRKRMEAAVKTPAGGLLMASARHAFAGALTALAKAPAQVARALMPAKKPVVRGEIVAEEIAEEAIEQTAKEKTLLGRATGAVERGLAGVGRSYVDGLVAAFERSQP
jgi:uncharacterized protein (DUF697 family)